ncbi:hypothetical protein ACQ4M3_09530 [Leptolyngbya sp. AN03gr2]|uniref:hypothetical protein n=1 Tax=Leptolyngbya sp. AN03gr2 TaxID=3423364 RepID=UPI003D31FC25
MRKPRLTYTLLSAAMISAGLAAYWSSTRTLIQTLIPLSLFAAGSLAGQLLIGTSLKYSFSVASQNWKFLNPYWLLYRGLTEAAPWMIYCPVLSTGIRLSYILILPSLAAWVIYLINPAFLMTLGDLPQINPFYFLWFALGLELANTVDICVFVNRRYKIQNTDFVLARTGLALGSEYKRIKSEIQKITDELVNHSLCRYCESDHEALDIFPFDPQFHKEGCLAPRLRSLIEEIHCSPLIESEKTEPEQNLNNETEKTVRL